MKTISHYFYLFNVVVVASAVFAHPANAGHYEIIKGKGMEVCEAYEKNLNSFNPSGPMVCERKVNPETPDFKKPKWQVLEPAQAEALMLEENDLALKAMGSSQTKEQKEGYSAWVKERVEKDKNAVLEVASVDINNDGKYETVLKNSDGDCNMHRTFSVNVAVLTDDGKHYDLAKSRYVSANFAQLAATLIQDDQRSLSTAGIARDNIDGAILYDIFLHKGIGYFDLWETGRYKYTPDPHVGRLHVFLHKSDKTTEICTYQFK